jgi:hypothetical protein
VTPTPIEVEAGDPASPVDHVDELFPVRQVSEKHQVVVTTGKELEDTWVAVDDDRPSISAPVHVLDTRDCLSGEAADHRFPVQRAVEGEPQSQAAVGHEPVALAAARAQHARCGLEDLLAGTVELPQASEARCVGDLGDREVGVVEKATSKMRTCRSRQTVGRDAQVDSEEAAKVPCGDAEPRTELDLASPVECTVEDQPDRPADELRRIP